LFTAAAIGRFALHRTFVPKSVDHFYATSAAERNDVVNTRRYQMKARLL
jgi:hypothetical protein